MFRVFVKEHLFTKKFFSLLICSTSAFYFSKIKSTERKNYLIKKVNEKNDQINSKSDALLAIEYENISSPKGNKNKNKSLNVRDEIENYKNFNQSQKGYIPSKNIFIPLGISISISIKKIFFFLAAINKISHPIAYCEVPKLEKPYLGCSIRSNEEGPKGMKILMIKSDSPAEKAGLKVKDLILEIDDKPVRNINEYNVAVGLEAKIKKFKILRLDADKENIIEIYVQFIYSQ